jgi:hypothetical protein
VIELRDARRAQLDAVNRRSGITATDIAWCGQVAQARRRQWAKAGRLKDEAPYTEYDALETAVAFSMTRSGVSQKAASAAWARIQEEVRGLLIAGERELWLVIGQGPHARAFSDAESAARYAAGEGLCWIVQTREAIATAHARYGELVTHTRAQPGGVAELQRIRRRVR